MAVEKHDIAGDGYKVLTDTGFQENIYIDALVHGGAGWDVNSGPITWYLADADDVRQNGDPGANHYGVWSQAEHDAFKAALACYSDVCGLTFQEASDPTTANLVEWKVPKGYINGLTGSPADGMHEYADGSHNHNNNPNQAWGYYEYENDFWNYTYPGGAGFYEMIHEIGHAMGLSHPFDHSPGQEHFPGADNSDSLGDNDLSQFPFTVMSYNQAWSGEPYPIGEFDRGRGASLGAFDIAALQKLYGVNTNAHLEANTYTLPTSNATGFWKCIWDAGGVDTIDNSASTLDSTIDLRPAPLVEGPNAGGYISWNHGVQGGLTIANGVNIEKAIGGSGDDTINGNNFANTLTGNAGNDTFNGYGDLDTLIGGTGNDTYYLQDRTSGLYDTVIEDANGGNDFVYITAIAHPQMGPVYTLTANVEGAQILGNIDFNLDGNDSDNRLFGNNQANILRGLDGDDKLIGSGGADTLFGGNGNDTYFLEDLIGGDGVVLTHYDTVVENENGGIDTVEVLSLDNPETFSDGYTLGANIENGEITGSRDFNLDGNELANKLTGNSAANILSGFEGNDILNGRAGNDTLDGGDGLDTAVFSGNYSAYTLTDLGNGSLQVVGPDGTDTLTSIERLQFADRTVSWPPAHPTNDFDADYNADILWRNSSTGEVRLWELNGGTIKANLGVDTVNSAWQIVGSGDFNGDGHADILWRNPSSGAIVEWQMTGAHTDANLTVGNLSSAWQIAGSADFDGDGKDDILWRNSNDGTVTLWQMNGDQIAVNTNIDAVSSAWHIVSTGDFNADGHADILWRNTTDGTVQLWEMNGSHIDANLTVGSPSTSTWMVATTGDFNGDGHADILWRNKGDGSVRLWEMNGNQITANLELDSVSNDWQIQDARDINGDGKDDIIWRNTAGGFNALNGDLRAWEMNGGQVIANLDLGVTASSWKVASDPFDHV